MRGRSARSQRSRKPSVWKWLCALIGQKNVRVTHFFAFYGVFQTHLDLTLARIFAEKGVDLVQPPSRIWSFHCHRCRPCCGPHQTPLSPPRNKSRDIYKCTFCETRKELFTSQFLLLISCLVTWKPLVGVPRLIMCEKWTINRSVGFVNSYISAPFVSDLLTVFIFRERFPSVCRGKMTKMVTSADKSHLLRVVHPAVSSTWAVLHGAQCILFLHPVSSAICHQRTCKDRCMDFRATMTARLCHCARPQGQAVDQNQVETIQTGINNPLNVSVNHTTLVNSFLFRVQQIRVF